MPRRKTTPEERAERRAADAFLLRRGDEESETARSHAHQRNIPMADYHYAKSVAYHQACAELRAGEHRRRSTHTFATIVKTVERNAERVGPPEADRTSPQPRRQRIAKRRMSDG